MERVASLTLAMRFALRTSVCERSWCRHPIEPVRAESPTSALSVNAAGAAGTFFRSNLMLGCIADRRSALLCTITSRLVEEKRQFGINTWGSIYSLHVRSQALLKQLEIKVDSVLHSSAMQLWLPPTLKSFLNFLWSTTFLILKHAMAVFDVPQTVAMLRAKVDAHRLTAIWHAGMCCRPTPNGLTQSV